MKAIGILLAVAAAAVVLLFFVCGFIFNQLVWRKTVSIPRCVTINWGNCADIIVSPVWRNYI